MKLLLEWLTRPPPNVYLFHSFGFGKNYSKTGAVLQSSSSLSVLQLLSLGELLTSWQMPKRGGNAVEGVLHSLSIAEINIDYAVKMKKHLSVRMFESYTAKP